MKGNEINATFSENEVSFKELIITIKKTLRFLKSRWRIILFAFLLGSTTGLVYTFLKKSYYQAEISYVLDEGASNNSQYGGVAAMLGFNLGNGSDGGLFKSSNLVEFIKSRTMIESTLFSKVFYGDKEVRLLDKYIEISRLDLKQDQPEYIGINFNKARTSFSRQEASILATIRADIVRNLEFNKLEKSNIQTVKFNSADELFAKVFLEKLIANVSDYYIRTKAKRAFDNTAILQNKADSIRRELRLSLRGVASSLDAVPNANPARQVLRVPSQYRQLDVQALSSTYEEVLKNLELSKIALQKEIPIIQVVDYPVIPLSRIEPQKILFSVLGGIFFSALIIIYLLLKGFMRDLNN